jgi:hypothetical protein
LRRDFPDRRRKFPVLPLPGISSQAIAFARVIRRHHVVKWLRSVNFSVNLPVRAYCGASVV